MLYALSNFSAANYYSTPNPGGEPGDATGWLDVFSFELRSFPPTTQTFVGRLNNLGGPASAGWLMYIVSTGALGLAVASAAGTYITVSRQLSPSDIGRIHVVALQHTGAGALLRASLDHYTLPTLAITGMTPWAGPTSIGVANTGSAVSQGLTCASMLANATFLGTPSQAQVDAYLEAARSSGDLPLTMAGATPSHSWSLKRELALLGGAVVDGQAAPASIRDSITGAVADVMSKVGTPTVRVIDPSIDGRKTYGVQGLSAADGLQTAIGAGLLGVGTGFYLLGAVTIYPGTTANRFVFHRLSGASTGYSIDVNAAGTLLRLIMYTAAGALISINVTVSTADHGRPMLMGIHHDGTNAKCWWNRVPSAGSLCAGIAQSVGFPLKIGTTASESLAVHALMGAHYSPTVGEFETAYDDFARTGQLQPIPGSSGAQLKTEHLWRITDDIVANGGADAGVPATVLDRIGTDHMTRQGTGLTVAVKTERLYSYETAPILYGAQSLSAANFWSVAGGFAGDPAGFMVELLLRIDSQTVASATRILVGKRDNGNPGWHIATSATNSTIVFALGGAAAAGASPTAVISSSDVGKLLSVTGVWDATAGKVRQYLKRLEASTGNVFAGAPFVASSAAFTLGKRSDGFGSDGVTIFGFRAGNFIPTFADVQSAHDRLLANERMTATDYPGRTLSCMYRFDSGVSPATLNDLIGSAHLAQSGAPTVVAQYARAFGW
jgi:hypothetical protein